MILEAVNTVAEPSAPQVTHRVGILIYDHVTLLDVAGPADVFCHATLFGASYEMVAISPDGRDATASNGLTLRAAMAASDVDRLDIVVIPGALGMVTRPFDPELLASVEVLIGRSAQIASVCTGSFLLAHVGALDGRCATTHWTRIEQFRRSYPAVHVKEDVLFVRDGSIITAAGVSSGIDLALSMVEDQYGPDLARKVLRQMLVFMQRPGGHSQFSNWSRTAVSSDNPLRTLLDAIAADPAGDYSLPRMAAAAGVSPRTLNRLFRSQIGITPTRYVEQARTEAAKAMLLQGATVGRAAQLSGFGSAETLRRVFVNQVGVSPSVYAQTGGSELGVA
jgi:transcriptional regulator GlxA family with amidase domain